MVDFQSRDTTRGLSSDDEDDEAERAEESETEEAEAEATESAEPAAEQDDAEPAESGEADAGASDAEAADAGGSDSAATDAGGPDAGAAEADADAVAAQESTAEGTTADDHDHAHTDHGDDHDHQHSHADHHHADVEQLGVAVVTVSSSRSLDDDPSGDAAQELVEEAGHSVVARDLVADDLDGVQRGILALTGREDVDVVVTTGGTGVTPDDVTVEAVEPLFDKDLPGFGELFRILSYEEIGTRAMGSRATGGVSEGVPVFCLPGSEDAVRTGVEELILAEAPHLVGLASED